MTEDNVIVYANVREIEPYREDPEKATQHVASAIGKSYEETAVLIELGRVYLMINKQTEETWFEVYDKE